MEFKEKSIDEFIKYIIKFGSIDDILDSLKSYSEKKIIYELIWNVIIKFGFCGLFDNKEYLHKLGNINTGKLKSLTSYKIYPL